MEEITEYFQQLEQMMRDISLSQLASVLQLLEQAYHNGPVFLLWAMVEVPQRLHILR